MSKNTMEVSYIIVIYRCLNIMEHGNYRCEIKETEWVESWGKRNDDPKCRIRSSNSKKSMKMWNYPENYIFQILILINSHHM